MGVLKGAVTLFEYDKPLNCFIPLLTKGDTIARTCTDRGIYIQSGSRWKLHIDCP
jgi:hypothetical protein